MEKLNNSVEAQAVDTGNLDKLDKTLLHKELFIKLNHLAANHIQGSSIPYFNENRAIYLFTSYERAANVEDKLNEELNSYAVQKENVVSAVKIPKITYIGKVNPINNNIDMQKEPLEFINTLDVILTNAKFLGIEKVVFDMDTEDEITADLNALLEKLDINTEQPKIVMTEEEREAILNKQAPFQLRFNPVNIMHYSNPFTIGNQKGLDLSELLFDDEADDLKSHLQDLEYNELAFMSHQIFNEYIPMAKNMENEGMVKNFEGYQKQLLEFIAGKIVNDLKDGKAFFLILNKYEDMKFRVQKGANGIIPFIYTDFFANNNENPLCLVNSYDAFKQFIENEKPTALQVSAGPIATILLPINYIVDKLN